MNVYCTLVDYNYINFINTSLHLEYINYHYVALAMKLVVSKCTKELSGLKVCWLTMGALNIQDWLRKNSVMERCPLISPVLGLTALITSYMYIIINMMCFGA